VENIYIKSSLCSLECATVPPYSLSISFSMFEIHQMSSGNILIYSKSLYTLCAFYKPESAICQRKITIWSPKKPSKRKRTSSLTSERIFPQGQPTWSHWHSHTHLYFEPFKKAYMQCTYHTGLREAKCFCQYIAE